MKITKSSIERDSMVKGHIIHVDIETIDNFDDPIKIKLTAMITRFELKQFQVEPSWSGVKFTRQQVFSIINKLYPAECSELNIGLLDDMKHMIPKMDKKSEQYANWDEDVPGEPDKDSLIQDLVRRNIDLVLENLLLGVKKGRLFSASFVDEKTLSSRILEIFEEYKNIS